VVWLSSLLQHNQTVSTLYLNSIRVQEHGISALTRCFSSRHAHSPNTLTSLTLSNCEIEDSQARLLATGLHFIPALTALDLSENRFGDKGVYHLCTIGIFSLVRLRSLNLSNSRNLTDLSLSYIALHVPQLKTLHLSRCPRFTSCGLSHLARGCVHLQHLHLANCKKILRALISEALLLNAPTSPRPRSLSHINTASYTMLASSKRSRRFHRSPVKVYANNLEIKYNTRHKHYLRHSFSINKTKKKNIKKNNNQSDDNNNAAVHMDDHKIPFSAVFHRLQELNLRNCVTDSHMPKLHLVFPNITSLNLSHCTSLTHIGIIEYVPCFKCLTHVNVSHCRIKHRDIKELQEKVKKAVSSRGKQDHDDVDVVDDNDDTNVTKNNKNNDKNHTDNKSKSGGITKRKELLITANHLESGYQQRIDMPIDDQGSNAQVRCKCGVLVTRLLYRVSFFVLLWLLLL